MQDSCGGRTAVSTNFLRFRSSCLVHILIGGVTMLHRENTQM